MSTTAAAASFMHQEKGNIQTSSTTAYLPAAIKPINTNNNNSNMNGVAAVTPSRDLSRRLPKKSSERNLNGSSGSSNKLSIVPNFPQSMRQITMGFPSSEDSIIGGGGLTSGQNSISSSKKKMIMHKRYASNALMDYSSRSSSGFVDQSKRSNSSSTNFFLPHSTTSQQSASNFFQQQLQQSPPLSTSASQQLQHHNFTSQQQQSSALSSSRQILDEFMLLGLKGGQDVELVQQAVKEVLKEIARLDQENRMLKKENAKHVKMLEIGQISFKLKDSYFQKIISTNIQIKSELDELKMQKLQIKQMELIKDMKAQPPIQIPIGGVNVASPMRQRMPTQIGANPTSSSASSNTNLQTGGTIIISNAQQSQQNNAPMSPDVNQGQKWRQMKQALEQNNIITGKFTEPAAASTTVAKSSIEIGAAGTTTQSSSALVAATPTPLRLRKAVQAHGNSLNSVTSTNLGSAGNVTGTAGAGVTAGTALQPSAASSLLNNSTNQRMLRLLKNPMHGSALSVFQQQDKKNMRIEFIQHSMDNAHYASALDIAISDKEITDFFLDGKYIKFVKGHFSDESNLQKFIFNLEGQTFKYFYDSVNSLLSHLNVSMSLILKAKQVIRGIHNLQQKMNISEVFETISQQTEKLLQCQRASVFLLDEKSNLFWTKHPSNNQMIKVSLTESAFCSHVAKTCETINVMDAQLDDRFDKAIDKKHAQKTKSVLCTPIFDSKSSTKRVMGILQVVNKNEGGFFTKDDESILKVIGLLSENILKNSVFNDERAEFYNSLRFLFQFSIDAIQANSVEQLIEISYVFLQRSLNIPAANIVLRDSKTNSFYSITEGKRIEYSTNDGIVGKVFGSMNIHVSNNVSEDIDFNRIIDIETQLPVITLPIFEANRNTPGSVSDRNIGGQLSGRYSKFMHQEASCIGVLQVINSRGIHSLIIQSENEPKVLLTNYETLQRFNLLFAAALSRLNV